MTHNAGFQKGLGNCCQLSPVTGTGEPSACSSAAVPSTTETLLAADAVPWVAFGGFFDHLVELQ